ncbi:MAG: hypothetical protein GC156_05585 [Actinomycetales bacterium]|nr:hypothetical protein [Actinomycetales bacterium]
MSSGSGDRRRQRVALIVIIVVILGMVGAVLLLQPKDADTTATAPTGSASAAAAPASAEPQVVLLVAQDEPQADFTPPVGEGMLVEPIAADSPTGLVDVKGDEVGLYGGTLQLGSCDRTQLADYLEAHPSKAEAWASVREVPVDGIRDHLFRLTPLVLRADTLVTNHGYENGTATSFPSILQAGTAVLVDDYGVPAVRCFCGNPLSAAPDLAPGTSYEGKKWKGWKPERTVRVKPSDRIIDNFTAVDPASGSMFTRPVGTDGAQDTDTGEPVPAGVPGVVVDPGPLSPVPGAGSPPAASAAETSAPVPDGDGGAMATERPAGEPVELFRVDSIAGVSSGPPKPTIFTLGGPAFVTSVMTYHYLNQGAPPGTLAFEGEDGTVYGPWPTVGSEGQGGVANAYWTAEPNVVVPAGTYTVIDSDPSTWSWALDTDQRGITIIQGIPVGEG